MQATLTRVTRNSKDKNGKPYINKNGKPFTRLGIQTQEHGAKWLSGFDNHATASWKEGDTVEIAVEEKGEYLNFSTPRPAALGYTAEDRDRMMRMEIQLIRIVDLLKNQPEDNRPEPDF